VLVELAAYIPLTEQTAAILHLAWLQLLPLVVALVVAVTHQFNPVKTVVRVVAVVKETTLRQITELEH
tara:strand:+ start:113 stop:316 length:204 start_codon:yes stop_codon:yes gene_type:complete